jgi:hypothetical protein
MKWLTPDEVVARLRLPTRNALYLLNHRRSGPKPTRFGRRLRYSEEDVARFERGEPWADDDEEKEEAAAA